MKLATEGVFKVEVTTVDPFPSRPWQRMDQKRRVGTGFFLEQDAAQKPLLLTSAHVVQSATVIRFQHFGTTYRARTLVYAPDVDLAILEVTDATKPDSFLSRPERTPTGKKSKQSLAFELAPNLPALQEPITVVGFPAGGTASGGVVIQVDSAINAGNSGGPALNEQGQVIGVAVGKLCVDSMSIDNVGYLLPAVTVRNFLRRVRRDEVDKKGFPKYKLAASVPYRWHTLENKSLRSAHNVPDSVNGILITSVCETVVGTKDDSLQKGDVLTHIDNVPIGNDGQVVLRGTEFIRHEYLITTKDLEETIKLVVLRNGTQEICHPFHLQYIPSVVPLWKHVDSQPDYMILGACVLLPFSRALVHCEGCGPDLRADFRNWFEKWPHEFQGKRQLVILVDILDHDVTFGYHRPWSLVLQYNGVSIQSLEHLKGLWKESCETDPDGYAKLTLKDEYDIFLKVSAAQTAQAELMDTFQIPKAYCIHPIKSQYENL